MIEIALISRLARICVIVVGILALCGCGTRNVGLPPSFLGAVITAPPIMRGGQSATWTAGLVGGTEPYAVNWNFGGGAVPNTVVSENVSRSASDFEVDFAVATAETVMIDGNWTVSITVTDAAGGGYTVTQDYTVDSGLPTNQGPAAVLIADQLSGLAPLAVLFDATGSADPDGSIALLEWDFDGDGAFGEAGAEAAAQDETEPAPYVYSDAGTFAPRVRVTDDGTPALTATASVNISVSTPANQPPTVTVAASPGTGVAPLSVDFTATAGDPEGSIASYEWDFDGDGVYDENTGATPTAQYSYAAGSFTARVRVTDSGTPGLTATATVPVVVAAANAAPSAAISAAPTGGSAPLTVDFDASASLDPDGVITKYEWDFTDDGTYDLDSGATAAAQFVYLAAGTYTARVRVSDNGSPALSSTATVSFAIDAGNTAPAVTLEAQPAAGTAPLSVSFTATALDPDGAIVSYEWDFSDDGTFDENTGTTPAANQSYASPGSFTARVRVTDNGSPALSATATVGITVSAANVAPTVTLEVLPGSGLAPLDANFTAAALDPDGAIVSYEWDFEDDGTFDTTTALNTTQHNYTTAGTYTARVRVTDDGSPALSATATATVTVTAPNQPPVAILGSDMSGGNVPLPIEFNSVSSSDPDGNGLTFQWDWENDGTIDQSGPEEFVNHTYTTQGVFVCRLVVTDDGTPPLSSSSQTTITVGPPNVGPSASLTGPEFAAPMTEVLFNASGSLDPDGSIVLYEWDWDNNGVFDDDTPSPIASHVFDTTGVFTVVVRVSDDGNPTLTATATRTIFINNP